MPLKPPTYDKPLTGAGSEGRWSEPTTAPQYKQLSDAALEAAKLLVDAQEAITTAFVSVRGYSTVTLWNFYTSLWELPAVIKYIQHSTDLHARVASIMIRNHISRCFRQWVEAQE